jgi:Peptidase MA superfamily
VLTGTRGAVHGGRHRIRGPIAVLITACGALVTPTVRAAPDAAERDEPVLQVEAPPALARQAAAVAAIAREDWRSVLELVGLPRPGAPIRVVLAPEGSPLAGRVASWVSGYAVPELDTVVLFPARVPSYPDGNLEALVRHEIAHVLLARAAGGGTVPRWFNEGTATVAAREWGIEDSARVVLATIGRGPRSLGELDAGFSGDTAAASRSYAVSAALVRYLLGTHGDGAVGRVLAGVARGADFDDAFAAATGESVHAFARAYFRRETFWTTWVPFVTSTTALWMAITVLALLAVKRRRARDAALREGWAVEERGLADRGAPAPSKDDPSRWN